MADPHLRWHREGHERAVAATDRFAAYVRTIGADRLTAPVPGMSWTAADVVAHVHAVYRRYTLDRRRAATPREVDAQNEADLHDGVAGDLDARLSDMRAQLVSLAPAIDRVDPHQAFPFHGGRTITLAGGWGNLLGELLAHGDDIARATGAAWQIDAADLEVLWRCTTPVLGGWLSDAGRAATDTWRIDLGFASGPVMFRFRGGDLAIDDVAADAPALDLRLDPIAGTLAVPYGRRPLEGAAMQQFAARFVAL